MTTGSADSKIRVLSWGMVQSSESFVRKPRSVDDVVAAFEEARSRGLAVGLRGAGNSYGDASLNQDGLLLDFTGMSRILSWDPETGLIDVEPGATISDIWRHTVGDGYWPPVVSGTMKVSLGGAASMNIHGKNNYKAGTIGEHILEFDLVTPAGDVLTCSRETHDDVFHAAIGGIGMLGVFTRIRLRMKRVGSGLVRVTPHAVRDFAETCELFEELCPDSDYAVGWHDAWGSGDELGRGLMHTANILAADEDPDASETLKPESQVLPSRIMGVFPKSWMWMGLWFFMNDAGMRLINAVKYRLGRGHAGSQRLESHAGYHFLLDYIPNYKYSFKPGGLIQYQSFIPKEHAARVFGRLVETARRHGIPPYLLVTKRHRMDPFLMTHAVDGFSMAMDIRVTRRNKDRVWTLARGLDEIVTDAGGRFYFAKDSVMRPAVLERAYPAERLEPFLAMKKRLDPDGILQTDLFRRVFAGKLEGAPLAEPV